MMMMSPIGKRNKGFTLLEIMISVGILSIGLTLILQGLMHSLNILQISQDNLKATFVTENKMAEVEIKVKEGKELFLDELGEEFEFEDIDCVWGIKFSPVELEIEEALDKEYEDLNEIVAIMSWEEGKRKGKVPLVTYLRSYKD